MAIRKYLNKILFFILIISIQIMNGQSKKSADNNLNLQQQSIVAISSLTAVGDVNKLKEQLNSGLDSGVSINEIKEILVQLYAYCGFPRSLNAISSFMNVLEERKSKGIHDPEGKKNVLNNDPDKYEQGRKVLEILTKTPQSKPAPGFGEFAPRIDAFLKEHLFADIFDSDVLTYQQRELVTIAALSAMPGLESQLQSHIKMGINTGITENQLVQAAALIEKYINKEQAESFRKLFLKPADTATVNKGN
ncbi:alkylhydroperoxidase/carboxymuconolactone decarboxylase family protein YurZ [Chryseobacterium sp. H1D6B]|uniref:carboxymuconolactone decarboxylase family protein n=1 Tax=Chryseobacterium sp. H1D6B TaxID=2940588 RepID=UPI0015CC2635|nr:carboxymuconolactone decarboxylase family protein [Chryseobacterium sp. H1D6B]MDH6250289.1 alkylhydroperoxidase/carboxymuconolactone decarboxylase family protein YurZ [Chryseobacterium sp. H1D6B]